MDKERITRKEKMTESWHNKMGVLKCFGQNILNVHFEFSATPRLDFSNSQVIKHE